MKKLLLISLTFGASWVSLFADPLQLDKLGTTVFNVREYPFRKPPVPASTTSLQAVASESNLLFKDALPHILAPTGIKRDGNVVSLLLGDRFYVEGDVLAVEILKDAQKYDSAAESVLISAISDTDFIVSIGEKSDKVSIKLPPAEQLKTLPHGVTNDFGKITFLRHEVPLKDVVEKGK